MDAKKIQEIWDNIDYERTRNSPPEGFPKLPEIPGKRYTDINLYNLETVSYTHLTLPTILRV